MPKKKMNSKMLIICFTLLFMVVSLLFTSFNDRFYSKPIGKITEVKITDQSDMTDQHGNKDVLFTQELHAIITNGKFKGQSVVLENEYSKSKAYDHPYRKGTKLFLEIDKAQKHDGDIEAKIVNAKRDHALLVMTWIFLILLLWIGKKQGIWIVVSLFLNIAILFFAIYLYVTLDLNLLLISGLLVVIFTFISLFITNGINEKSITAVIATLLGTAISLIIGVIVLKVTNENGLHYEEMQFLTRPYSLVFLAGLFIGALGAIMDVSMTIASALHELLLYNHQLSKKEFKKAGKEIGQDIMGTITNVLFFGYISGSIPTLILYFKNQSPLGFTLSINLSLELARFLVGGIGIVVTIPLTIYLALHFMYGRKMPS